MTNVKHIEERMGKAIDAILARNEYPSAARINREMGRRTSTLNGRECGVRHRLMAARNVKVRRVGWAEPQPTDWWNI